MRVCVCEQQEDIDEEEEAEDSFSDKEEDLGVVEEERSVILHLLSQLKLGMDLTRVSPVPPHTHTHTRTQSLRWEAQVDKDTLYSKAGLRPR